MGNSVKRVSTRSKRVEVKKVVEFLNPLEFANEDWVFETLTALEFYLKRPFSVNVFTEDFGKQSFQYDAKELDLEYVDQKALNRVRELLA